MPFAVTRQPCPQIVDTDIIKCLATINTHSGQTVEHIDTICFQRIFTGGAIRTQRMEESIDNRDDGSAYHMFQLLR